MPEIQVQRRLVKSTPELWAEISDIGSLAKHLDEFGEIRITRTEPDTTVAWEGDAVSGTVQIEGSGWGTRVVITVDEPAAETPAPPDPAPPVPDPDEPIPQPLPTPSAPVAETPEPQPEPTPAPEPVTIAPRVAPPPKKRGFLARLLGGGNPEPRAAFTPPREENAARPEPEPAAEEPAAAFSPSQEEKAARPEPGPAFDTDHTATILEGVLDDLGAAHHRPFSRS